jgi:hypothetical protein
MLRVILGDIEPKEGDMNESKTDAGKNEYLMLSWMIPQTKWLMLC